MSGIRTKQIYSKKSLSPLILWLIALIATEIFSTAVDKWLDSLGALAGYKLLLLTILLLICIILALLFPSKKVIENQKVTSELINLNSLSQKENNQIRYLENLLRPEAVLLSKLFLNTMIDHNRFELLNTLDPLVHSLEKENVLIALNEWSEFEKWYKIDEFVLIYLKKHPDLLSNKL